MQSRVGIWAAGFLITISLMLIGCKQDASQGDGKKAAEAHVHEHAEEGPHKGHLIELGEEEYHAELVHDDAAGKVTIYLLDGHAKDAVSADADTVTVSVLVEGQPKEFVLKATDAAKRDQFESSEKEIVGALDHDKSVKGRLRVAVGGKPFNGTIDHEKHEH